MRILHLVSSLALLAACGPDFDPAWRVTDLRILGVQADPPELDAGEAARVRTLVVDPSSTEPLVALHLVCAPDAGGESPCTDLEPLRDLPGLLRSAAAGSCEGPGALGTAIPGGVALVGAERCDPAGGCSELIAGLEVVVTVPAEMTLAGLPAGDPDRLRGRELAVITAVVRGGDELLPSPGCEGVRALPAVVAGIVERGARDVDWVMGVKRIRLRGPDSVDEPDMNPGAPELEVPPSVSPGAGAELHARATSAPQRYVARGPSGEDGPVVEEAFTFSWFVSAGELEERRTREAPARWTAPEEPGAVQAWVLLRDRRGGVSWAARGIPVR